MPNRMKLPSDTELSHKPLQNGSSSSHPGEWTAQQWDWPLQHHDGVVDVINNNEKFEVGLEMHYFAPKEIEVKVMGYDLVIHCHHHDRSEGSITRELNRIYKIPPDVDVDTLRSSLLPNGILLVSAQKLR